jgi:hypothetical protein
MGGGILVSTRIVSPAREHEPARTPVEVFGPRPSPPQGA